MKSEASALAAKELKPHLIAWERIAQAVELLPDLEHGRIDFLKTRDKAI